jgi:hypothetical protein
MTLTIQDNRKKALRQEKLRSSGSKVRRFCPSEAKADRFKASLSSTFGRGTMPRSAFHTAFSTTPPSPRERSKIGRLFFSIKYLRIILFYLFVLF